MKAPVEAIGIYSLITDNGHHLDLLETFYIPSISRNLVSLSKLDKPRYVFRFGSGCFSLYKNTCMVVVEHYMMVYIK